MRVGVVRGYIMAEGVSRSMYKQRPTKVAAPVVYRKPVCLGTEVPARPRTEDLVPAPDEKAFRIEMSRLSRRVNQTKKKLADKTEVHPNQVLSFSELQERLRRLKERQIALHKERKEVEARLKPLNKEIKVRKTQTLGPSIRQATQKQGKSNLEAARASQGVSCAQSIERC